MELTWEEKRAKAKEAAAALAAAESRGDPTPIKREVKVPSKKPQSKIDMIKTVAKGVADSARAKMDSLVPNANKEYQENRRRAIDKAVDD